MKMRMESMIKSIRKKLSGNQGDSIAEVLIALLISSLALVMLASMITSSSKMIISSKTKMEEYYSSSGALASPATSASPAPVGSKVAFGLYGQETEYDVKYVEDPAFSVISFQKSP